MEGFFGNNINHGTWNQFHHKKKNCVCIKIINFCGQKLSFVDFFAFQMIYFYIIYNLHLDQHSSNIFKEEKK